MKVYFSTSLSQMTPQTKEIARRIVVFLEKKGHKVLTSDLLSTKKDAHYKIQSEDQSVQAQRLLTKLKKVADVVVVDITQPSLGVGQEVAIALSLNKPVIALHNEKTDPHLLKDEAGELLIEEAYAESNVEEVLDGALDYAQSHQDVRFNFFISPAISYYLDWIAQHKKVPRSVYLRNLIEDDMNNNEEYNSSKA